MRYARGLLLGCAAALFATAAPASQKPCRDQNGTVIVCRKAPPKPAPVRCKDEKGRFVSCKPAGSQPKPI